MFNWFKRDKVDFKFIDVTGGAYLNYPPIPAKDIKPLKEHQEKKYGKYTFPQCPGMFDYARMGYIITSPITVHVKANKAGSAVVVGARGDGAAARPTVFRQANVMSVEITDGLFEYQDGVTPQVYSIGTPWRIAMPKTSTMSCLLMPAYYHSTFLEDAYVFPGVVDFSSGFGMINFILSPKRKCEFEIKAGDPILQFIPVQNPPIVSASYGPSNVHGYNNDRTVNHIDISNFYRKFFQIKKQFKIKKHFKYDDGKVWTLKDEYGMSDK